MKDFQSRATLVAASRYKLYFYLNPEVLTCKTQRFKVPLALALLLHRALAASFSALYVLCHSQFPVNYKCYR